MELMKKMNISMALAWLITGMVFFCSCSGSDYINAIPANSSALISIDMQKMAESNPQASKTGVLKSLLHVEDVTDCGIDVSEKCISLRLLMGTWDFVQRFLMLPIWKIG